MLDTVRGYFSDYRNEKAHLTTHDVSKLVSDFCDENKQRVSIRENLYRLLLTSHYADVERDWIVNQNIICYQLATTDTSDYKNLMIFYISGSGELMKIDKYNTELPARSQVLAQVGTPEFYTQLNELKNLGYQIFDPMKLKH